MLDIYRELTQATVKPSRIQDYTELRELLVTGAFDVALVPDELLAMLVKNQRLLPLNPGGVPILNYFRSRPGTIGLRDFPEIDPKFEFSVPYFIGRSGIAYNSDLIANIHNHSWSEILDFDNTFQRLDHVLDRRVDIAVDHRIAMGLALRAGDSPVNSENPAEISAAGQRLMRIGHLVGNLAPQQFIHRLATNAAIIGVCWEDHARHAARLKPKIQFVIPRDGSIAYLDSLVINRNTKQPELAQHLVRFLTDPEIAAEVSNHTLSRTAIPGTKPYLAADQVSDAGFLPTDNNSKDFYLHAIDRSTEESYQWFWNTFTNTLTGNLPTANLGLHVSASTNQWVGRPAEIWFDLANTGRESLSDLKLTLDSSSDAIEEPVQAWELESLAPGRIEPLRARVTSQQAGTTPIKIHVRDESGIKFNHPLVLTWRDTPAFELTLSGRNSPVRVGETNTYTLTLRNVGQGPDQITGGRLEFSSAIEPTQVIGTTEGTVSSAGGLHFIELSDLQELRPDDAATWTIAAVARARGTAVIHAEVTTRFTAPKKISSPTTTRVF
ncbi:MAG: extracellular solute-binding protein [Limisphaerales bacterium]